MGISAIPARFKADFGLFRPFRSPADTTRYGSILVELARFGANQSRFGSNRVMLARIVPSQREYEEKKKKKEA